MRLRCSNEVRSQDARASCDVEPILFEFGQRKLGCTPARNDSPVPARGKIDLMFADDFTQSAADGIAHDGAANFLASDEAKAEVRKFVDGSGR